MRTNISIEVDALGCASFYSSAFLIRIVDPIKMLCATSARRFLRFGQRRVNRFAKAEMA
jgi:hypothetical protein